MNAPPGLTFPGDPGFNGKKGENNEWASVGAPRGGRLGPQRRRQNRCPRFLGNRLRLQRGELMVNAADAPPYGGTEIWSGSTFSNPYLSNPGGNIFPYTPSQCAVCRGRSLYRLPPNMKTTSVNQWNLTLQHQFGNDWLVSAQYIGSESAHLLDSYQLNPAVFIPGNCSPASMVSRPPAPAPPRRTRTIAGHSCSPDYPGALLPHGPGSYGYVDIVRRRRDIQLQRHAPGRHRSA